MKFEVGKLYRVGGNDLETGNMIKITSKCDAYGVTRYSYRIISGNYRNIAFDSFDAGSIFAKSLVPVVLYRKSEILARSPKLVVVKDKNRVIASWYEGGKNVAAGVAKCSPEDTFDFATGARIAFDRLMREKSSMSREDIYLNSKEAFSTIKDLKRVVAVSVWTRFELGKMAVQVNRETIDDFLKECEERGYKWRCGDKATERNPFRDYDGLSPVGVTVFEILKLVPKDSIWIRMYKGSLAMDIDEKPDDVEIYNWQ
nr:MAG TPA: hypothetical protein [Caudoviricetes sp.]